MHAFTRYKLAFESSLKILKIRKLNALNIEKYPSINFFKCKKLLIFFVFTNNNEE